MKRIKTHTRRPDLTVYRNGKILITARIARMLELQTGDSVNIYTDDGEFLLYKESHAMGRHTGHVYRTKRRAGTFCSNSVALARMLLSAAKTGEAGKTSFYAGYPMIVDNDMTVIPIITRNPIIY